ncbi:ES8L3 protein, partial [Halcyon senegalensis]|nr:ES8L3 protein [Halcyon senegalensis]
DDYSTWKSLGMAWNKTRAEFFGGERVPGYRPTFSDGWVPPPLDQVRHRGGDATGDTPTQDGPPPASVSPTGSHHPPPLPVPHQVTNQRDNPGQVDPSPAQGLVRALYEFQARNSKELSVRMGDTLQVLDQQKKWWLVQDSQGRRGYVPGNILEPVGKGHRGELSASQDRPPNLLPESSPAEVTAWLKDKGFSRM